MGQKRKKNQIIGPIIRNTVQHECFCGLRLIDGKVTCGSSECLRLANQFGEVSNWLNQETFILIDSSIAEDRSEEKIMKSLIGVYGATQKDLAYETGLATSTISNALNRLEKKGLVWKDIFHNTHGVLDYKKRKGGKPTTIWRVIE